MMARGGRLIFGAHPCPFSINSHEIDMSADKDRGIRRQKQKRAKALKREAKQRTPAGGDTPQVSSAAPQAAP